MKYKFLAAALLSLGCVASGYANAYTYDTNALSNSTNGQNISGASAIGGSLFVTAGEQFTVSTDPGQIWHAAALGDPNYHDLTSNANGTTDPAWVFGLPDLPSVEVGSLVADIGGEYAFIGAGTHTFTAWNTGELLFNFADVNNGDNSGTVVSTVTVVPEPAGIALWALGLLALTVARRRSR